MKEKQHTVRGRYVIIPMLSMAMLTPAALVGAESSKTVMISSPAKPVQEEIKAPNPENVKFSKDQAIEKVRQLFPLLKDAQVQEVALGDSYVYPPPANQMVWNIQWNYQKGNSGYGFNSMVDAITGDLISTHIGFPMEADNEAYYPPKVSREEALKIVKSFIAKAAPSLSTENLKEKAIPYLVNQPLFGPVRHSFNFERTVQGIPVPEESLNITVDGKGNVIEFHRQASTAKYPSAVAKVNLEEAIKKYKENVNLTLQYIPIHRGSDVEVFLGFRPAVPDFLVIDALTGEFLAPDGEPLGNGSTAYQDIPKSLEAFKPNASGKPLTAEEAAAIVQKVAKIPDGRSLQGKSLGSYRGNQEQSVWNLTYRDSKQQFYGPESETFAAVDAKTGQILEYEENRFGRPAPASDDDAKPNKEEAKKKAIELVQQLYPNASEELKFMELNPFSYYPNAENSISFGFQRFYEGIPVEGNNVNVTLNAKGQLLRLYTNQTPKLAEKVKGLSPKISKEEATKRYLEDSTVQLQFLRFGDRWNPEGAANTTVKLVYQQSFKDGLHGGFAIDAADGKWKSGWDPGVESQGDMVKPTDIAGHWAEESLQTLLRYQIIKTDLEGRVNPDQTITRGDWLNMIVKSVDPYYDRGYNEPTTLTELFEDVKKDNPYYPAARWALERQWLEAKERKLQLDQAMTREDLAVSLTHIINYDKLAKFMDAEETMFTDSAGIKSKGAVSIIARLGLMQGTNGKFNPESKVTKAQAAAILMGLVKLQGKTDVPIGQMYYR